MTREELDERLSEIQTYAWRAAVSNADNPLQDKLLDAHFSQVRDLIRDCIEAVTEDPLDVDARVEAMENPDETFYAGVRIAALAAHAKTQELLG